MGYFFKSLADLIYMHSKYACFTCFKNSTRLDWMRMGTQKAVSNLASHVIYYSSSCSQSSRQHKLWISLTAATGTITHGACTNAHIQIGIFYQSKCAPHPLCEWSPLAQWDFRCVWATRGWHTIKLHRSHQAEYITNTIQPPHEYLFLLTSASAIKMRFSSRTLFANASINYPLAGVAICVFASAAHQRAARENYMAEMIFFSALNAPCE
jgi:hypothetical protein